MKKSNLLPLLIATGFLFSFGCAKSDSSEHDRRMAAIKSNHEKQMADIEKMIQDSKDLAKLFNRGGQPGNISLGGVIIQADYNKLDPRVMVVQSAGENLDGTKAEVSATIKLSSVKGEDLLKIKSSPTETQKLKTFINLGCDLEVDEISGLTEKKLDLEDKSTSDLTATRVFICGKNVFTKKILLMITASDLMLKDAEIVYQENFGNLVLESNTLTLIGINKITSLGVNSASLVMTGPKIDMTVTTELYGDGALLIHSKGGNSIPVTNDSK